MENVSLIAPGLLSMTSVLQNMRSSPSADVGRQIEHIYKDICSRYRARQAMLGQER